MSRYDDNELGELKIAIICSFIGFVLGAIFMLFMWEYTDSLLAVAT